MGTYDEITKDGYTLKIFYEEGDAENPRDWDNLGRIKDLSRGRYLRDETAGEEFERAIALNIYVYDHSGVVYSTTPFDCQWDSGKAGVIFCTREDLRREYGVKRVTKSILKKGLETLKAEIEIYSDWAEGRVYRYSIENSVTGEEIDSCGGYYGDDGIKHIKEEFNSFIERQLKEDYPLFVFAGIDIKKVA